MKFRFSLVVCFALILLASEFAHAGARPDFRTRSWFGHFTLGYNSGSGDFGDIVDDDLTFSVGATLWRPNSPVGFQFDLAYSEWDIDSSVIRAINDQLGPTDGEVTGGDVDSWKLMLNLLYGLGDTGLYLIGGIGVDDLGARLTDDALVFYPPVCDPWFWYCVPGGVGPGSVVQASDSETAFAWNVGIGYAVNRSNGHQIFVEMKYHAAELDRGEVEYIPASIGYRW